MQDLHKLSMFNLIEELVRLTKNNAKFINDVTFDSLRKKGKNYSILQLQVLFKHQNDLEAVVNELITREIDCE